MLGDVTSNAIAQSPAATPLAHSHGWHSAYGKLKERVELDSSPFSGQSDEELI
jgi:hypothetical protein